MEQTFEVKTSKNIDTIERTWRKNGVHPLTPVGQFPLNQLHQLYRVSETELWVITTENNKLRFVARHK